MNKNLIKDAIEQLQAVEQLFSNKPGKNEFRQYLIKLGMANACAASWIIDRLPGSLSYILDLLGVLEDDDPVMTEVTFKAGSTVITTQLNPEQLGALRDLLEVGSSDDDPDEHIQLASVTARQVIDVIDELFQPAGG